MLSRRVQRNLTRKIERKFDVKVILLKIQREMPNGKTEDYADVVAQADLDKEIVEVNTLTPMNRVSKDAFLSTVLHEVAHIIAKREGKFATFHQDCYLDDMTDRDLLVYMRTAYRAELYVEDRAAGLLQEISPGSMYWYSYSKGKVAESYKRSKKWMNEEQLADVKAEYRRRKLRKIDRAMNRRKRERKTEQSNS